MSGIFKIAAWFYAAIMFFCLTGCTTVLPIKVHLPGTIITQHRVPDIAPGTPFSIDPGQLRVATGKNVTAVISLETGKRTTFDAGSPYALAWSSDHTKLAALYSNISSTTLKVFNGRGALTAENSINGHTGSIFWTSDNDLLIATCHTAEHKFGTSVRQDLHHVKPDGKIVTTVLHETTFLPRTIKLYGTDYLLERFSPQISPLRDELLYVRLINAPLSTPYYKLFVRNLASGVEKEITRLEIKAGAYIFSQDNESVIWSDENRNIWQQQTWSNGLPDKLTVTGSEFAFSSDGAYKIIDNTLYRGEQKIADIPNDRGVPHFAESYIISAWKDSLYLLKGLTEIKKEAVISSELHKKLTSLRSWRSSGLITAEEYRKAKQRIVNNEN